MWGTECSGTRDAHKMTPTCEVRYQIAVYEQYPILNGPDLEPTNLTLFEAIVLHALFSDPPVEVAGLTSPTDIWPKERRWAPEQLRYNFERGLLKAVPRRLKAHPDSHLDAFALDDEGELSDSFYLGRVSYYLMGQANELTYPVRRHAGRVRRHVGTSVLMPGCTSRRTSPCFVPGRACLAVEAVVPEPESAARSVSRTTGCSPVRFS
jgi:hypothetical protein